MKKIIFDLQLNKIRKDPKELLEKLAKALKYFGLADDFLVHEIQDDIFEAKPWPVISQKILAQAKVDSPDEAMVLRKLLTEAYQHLPQKRYGGMSQIEYQMQKQQRQSGKKAMAGDQRFDDKLSIAQEFEKDMQKKTDFLKDFLGSMNKKAAGPNQPMPFSGPPPTEMPMELFGPEGVQMDQAKLEQRQIYKLALLFTS